MIKRKMTNLVKVKDVLIGDKNDIVKDKQYQRCC
jgi:hypothetical protein